jgi:putative transposase
MVVHAFLANIDTTRQLRKEHPEMARAYPWREKRFYPVHWPAQAVSKEKGRVVLPMGKGRKSLVLPLDLPENAGACTLVWNRGFELTRLAWKFRETRPLRGTRRPRSTWEKSIWPP